MAEPRRCKAHSSRTGKACKNTPIPGGFVCRFHGGSAPQVKRAALNRMKEMLADALDPDRVLREAGCLAYSDITELFENDGRLKPMNQWPEHARRAVAGVEVVKRNLIVGDKLLDDVIKIRMHPKGERIQDLMKMHGKLSEKVEHTGALKITWEQ